MPKKHLNNFVLVAFGVFSIIFWIKLILINSFEHSSILKFGFTAEYTRISDLLINKKQFLDTLSDGTIIPLVKREPAYPVFLSLSKLLFNNYVSLIYFQWASLYLFFSLCLLLAKKNFGNIGALIFGLLLLGIPTPYFYASVLYPYTFQVILSGLSIYCFWIAVKNNSKKLFALSGLILALACYERGSLILLPLFLVMGFVLIQKLKLILIKIKLTNLLIFFLSWLIVLSPWLIRSLKNEYFGINAMTGYTLGYTYGSLNSPANSSLDYQTYDRKIQNINDVDGGTQKYIDQISRENNLSYAKADKLTAQIVLQKMIQNPQNVIQIIKLNIEHFGSRLSSLNIQTLTKDPFEMYRYHIARSNTSIWDLILLLLGIFGITYAAFYARRVDGWLGLIVILYIAILNTTIVVFDPRYRGVGDYILIYFATYSLTNIIKYIQSKYLKPTREPSLPFKENNLDSPAS